MSAMSVRTADGRWARALFSAVGCLAVAGCQDASSMAFSTAGVGPGIAVTAGLLLLALAALTTVAIRKRRAEKQLDAIFHNSLVGILLVGFDLRIRRANPTAAALLGYDHPDELLGRPVRRLHLNAGNYARMGDQYRHLLSGEDLIHEEYQLRRRDGSGVWCLVSGRPVMDAGGASGVIWVLDDISDRRCMEEELKRRAYHDPLTGLANRSLCLDRIGQALERSRRRADYFYAVLFVDLDRFKVINDSLGHTLGDDLLCETARRLESCVRELDTVSRFGGDEFVILLEELVSPRRAIQVVKRIRRELRKPFTLAHHEVQVTASIGIVLGPAEYDKPEELLQNANIAMHRAKERGRDRFNVFTARMLEHALMLMALENDMTRGLVRGEFFLVYQPVVRLDHGLTLCGFEALARWRHPDKEVIMPAEFIPVAEDSGLIQDLGLWVLHEACRTMAEWRETHNHLADKLFLSVNVSGRQFAQVDLVGKVRRILEKTGMPADRLKLELTETALMENASMAVDKLHQLRELGISLAIDDFGTGYSSMSYLQRLPLNDLKIDLGFVRRLGDSRESVEIVKTIIALAHTLGLSVVAEGVEREGHQEILRYLDCEYGQGYLYARPLEAPAAERLIVSGVAVGCAPNNENAPASGPEADQDAGGGLPQ